MTYKEKDLVYRVKYNKTRAEVAGEIGTTLPTLMKVLDVLDSGEELTKTTEMKVKLFFDAKQI